jgi:hypothetical protein
MSTAREIEAAVQDLSPSELSNFRKWFTEFDADAWDKQFEQDAQSGKLDALAEDVLKDLRKGRCNDL